MLDVLGDEAGEVIDQVEEIEPYYLDEQIAIFLVRKVSDNGDVFAHTMTFKVSADGSWKLHEI